MVLVDYAGGVDNLVAVLDLEPVEEGVPVVPVDGRLEDVGPVLSCTEGVVLVDEVVHLGGGPQGHLGLGPVDNSIAL